jgi:hypothetical protein
MQFNTDAVRHACEKLNNRTNINVHAVILFAFYDFI